LILGWSKRMSHEKKLARLQVIEPQVFVALSIRGGTFRPRRPISVVKQPCQTIPQK
jgi:hypothetical protein